MEHITKAWFTDGTEVTLAKWWEEAIGKTNYTRLPNIIERTNLGLDPHARCVLRYLLSWMLQTDPGRPLRTYRSGKPNGYITLKNIAEVEGMSVRSVQRAISKLQQMGYLATEQVRGRETLYRVELIEIMEAAWLEHGEVDDEGGD